MYKLATLIYIFSTATKVYMPAISLHSETMAKISPFIMKFKSI